MPNSESNLAGGGEGGVGTSRRTLEGGSEYIARTYGGSNDETVRQKAAAAGAKLLSSGKKEGKLGGGYLQAVQEKTQS